MSPLTITVDAIENTPVLERPISPDVPTEVATLEPLPTKIFPLVSTANLL